MALTPTHLDAGGKTGSNFTSNTTNSIAPAVNNIVVMFVFNHDHAGGTPQTPTVTGAGMTWTQVATRQCSGSPADRGTLFRALSASPGSGALTIDYNGVVQDNSYWSITEFSGCDAGGTNGANAIVQEADNDNTSTSLTVNLSTLANTSNANLSFGFSDNGSMSGLGSFTELNQTNSGGFFVESRWAVNQSSVNFTRSGNSGTFAAMSVEIKQSLSGGGLLMQM